MTLDTLNLKIGRMLNDCYSMLTMYIMIMIVLVLILIYFGYSLYTTIQQYYANLPAPSPIVENNPLNVIDDNEVYIGKTTNPQQYYDKKKREFVQNLDQSYYNYNDEKKRFIEKNFAGTNDYDQIDGNVFFSKYDDYNMSQHKK